MQTTWQSGIKPMIAGQLVAETAKAEGVVVRETPDGGKSPPGSSRAARATQTEPASRVLRVTVCACTYRRPNGLAALLKGLGKQTFTSLTRPSVGIVIADNEGSDQAKEACDQFKRSCDIPIEYVHEARRGISHARNACLARLQDDCDFFAMIDDDEIPDPDWIEQLLLAQQGADADVVQGRVLPVLPDGAPNWIVAGRYFGWDPLMDRVKGAQLNGYARLERARTNNVLVKYAVVRELGLRFDPRFALTGGEDIVFFQAINAAGRRIVHAPLACVREIVPPERTTLEYLCRMCYRLGCNDRFKAPGRRKPNSGIKHILRRKLRSIGGYAVLRGMALLIGNLLRG
ncbi:MAG: glycosyltransferase family 2 protein, partial [Geminicoccales bacterium]